MKRWLIDGRFYVYARDEEHAFEVFWGYHPDGAWEALPPGKRRALEDAGQTIELAGEWVEERFVKVKNGHGLVQVRRPARLE